MTFKAIFKNEICFAINAKTEKFNSIKSLTAQISNYVKYIWWWCRYNRQPILCNVYSCGVIDTANYIPIANKDCLNEQTVETIELEAERNATW